MASIQGIYIALFGRPADPRGLEYFNEVTNDGQDLTAIGDLASQDEYQSRFTGLSNEEIVNSIYQSLFERDGEPEGIAFYVAELEAGRLNINNVAIAILDGAQGEDLAMVNAKIAAADLFTASLDSEIEIDAYTDPADGRNFLDEVTPDNIPTQAEVDAFILAEVVEQGQAPGGGGGGGGGEPTPEELAEIEAQDILAEWRELDAAYGYIQNYGAPGAGNPALFGDYDDDTPVAGSEFGDTLGEAALGVNTAIVNLSIRYATLIEEFPQVALVDEAAKESETRFQSVHDNILGSISTVNNIGMPERNFPSEIQSDFDARIAAISGERDYTERPLYSGNDSAKGGDAHDGVREFDWSLGIDRNDSYVDVVSDGQIAPSGQNVEGGLNFGSGDSRTDGFEIARHEGAGIELGLKVVQRGSNVEYDTYTDEDGVQVFQADPGAGNASWANANWNFNFSVLTDINDDPTDIDDYEFVIRLDVDASEATDFVEFRLTDVETEAGTFRAWVGPDDAFFGGDEELMTVNMEQNSVNIGFNQLEGLFGEYADGDPGDFGAATFDIQLLAFKDGVELVGTTVRAEVQGFGDLS